MPELLKAIKAFKKSKYVKALPGVSNNMDKAHDLAEDFEEAVAAASSAEDLSPEQERAMAAWEKEAEVLVSNAETKLNDAREALKNEPPFPSANNLAKERWKEGTKVRVSNAQSELKAAKDTQRNGPPFSARKVAAKEAGEAKEKLEHLLIGLREDSRDIKDEARPLLEKVISELEAIMRPS